MLSWGGNVSLNGENVSLCVGSRVQNKELKEQMD